LQRAVEKARLEGKRIAFIPTMGALHEGHRSLIHQAKSPPAPLFQSGVKKNYFRVVSIFVNPTQFNSAEDLQKYPRTLGQDLKLCEREGVDLVFTPTVDEIYPDGLKTNIPVPEVGLPMEGEFRPGHFAGVCAVVHRLFKIVGPCVALFGEKDFQQVRVIEEMVREQKIPVEIVWCPTVRDKNGLALSSRNARLSPEGYQKALAIPRGIKAVQEGKGIKAAKKELANLKTDYFIIADSETLISEPDEMRGRPPRRDAGVLGRYVEERPRRPTKQIAGYEMSSRIFIAAWVEGVRLIDNDILQ